MRRKEPSRWNPPAAAELIDVASKATGSAGLDGWDASEVKALAKYAPFICEGACTFFTALTWKAPEGGIKDILRRIYAWRIVGIPKRGSDDSRPIAVASVWVRVWHRLLLNSLPDPPEGQWSEKGVVAATASWLQTDPETGQWPGEAGAEVDLAKAYDSVRLTAAEAALRHAGAPDAVASLLAASWAAPRHCHVQGELAAPLEPVCGILAGDPCSLRVLAVMLEPWHERVQKEVPEVETWAYVDDRSLKTHPTEEDTPVEDQQQSIAAALAVTDTFDKAVGLSENKKKRQVWSGTVKVEHLGIITDGVPDPEVGPGELGMPEPRDGWHPITEVIKRLAWIPGTAERRLRLFDMCITPKFAWAAPFATIPCGSDDALAKLVLRAVVGSHCTWWCNRRFWADNINRHPPTAVAIRNIRAFKRVAGTKSPLLTASLEQTAQYFSCDIVSASKRGLWLKPNPHADARFCTQASAAARVAEWPADLAEEVDLAGAFEADTPAGLHALRTAARANLLVQRTPARCRWDERGMNHIDVEAASHPLWTNFLKTLNFMQRTQLAVWRGGAIWTPTRRYMAPNDHRGDRRGQSQLEERHPPPTSRKARSAAMACAYCGYKMASSLHLVAYCPKFLNVRTMHARMFDETATGDLFTLLPECTVKSAWVTMNAHPNPARRVELQIMIARLGLDILFSPEETLLGRPHWTVQEEGDRLREHFAEERLAAANRPELPLQPHPPASSIEQYIPEGRE